MLENIRNKLVETNDFDEAESLYEEFKRIGYKTYGIEQFNNMMKFLYTFSSKDDILIEFIKYDSALKIFED